MVRRKSVSKKKYGGTRHSVRIGTRLAQFPGLHNHHYGKSFESSHKGWDLLGKMLSKNRRSMLVKTAIEEGVSKLGPKLLSYARPRLSGRRKSVARAYYGGGRRKSQNGSKSRRRRKTRKRRG